MKLKLTLVLGLLGFVLSGQTVSESLKVFTKKKSMLFSKKSAILSMDFIRTYTIGSADTAYNVAINVDSRELELEGLSVGALMIGRASAMATSGQYSINSDSGGVMIDKKGFEKMYGCVNDVYRFVGTRNAGKSKINAVATCNINDIVFGGEYNPRLGAPSNVKKFYFRIKDATFEMKEPEFLEVIRFVQDVRGSW